MVSNASMASVERAAEYIRQHGNALQQAWLNYMLYSEAIPEETVEAFLAGQREDGGWPPFWAPDATSVDATCYRLTQARQMNLFATYLQHPALARAVAFLYERQDTDGHWAEDAALREVAPPWAQPDDPAAILYLTANCGFLLALLERWHHLEGGMAAGRAASNYLLGNLREDGTLPSFLHTHWLAAGLWYLLDEREACNRMLEILGQRVVNGMSPGNLVWLINTLLEAGMNDHPLLASAVSQLIAAQREDGSWPGDDGPQFDTTTTIEAIAALMS